MLQGHNSLTCIVWVPAQGIQASVTEPAGMGAILI